MTTPGGQFPDDTLGDDLSPLQGITQESWEMGVRNKAIAPYNNGHNNLADLLGSILQNLARAAMQGLGAIAEGFANLFGAVVEGIGNFLNGLTAAILGQNPSGQVPPSVGSSFADIRDGQRALIGKIETLEDNPGFINLCMSQNWDVTGRGYDFKWLPCRFDALVTENKNAIPIHFTIRGGLGKDNMVAPAGQYPKGGGFLIQAPGVWDIDLQTVSRALNSNGTPDTAPRYFEVSVRIYEYLSPKPSTEFGEGDGIYLEENRPAGSYGTIPYSETKTPWTTGGGVLQTGMVNKPVLIPEEYQDEDGAYHIFVVAAYIRFSGATRWSTWGGTLYSSFSAKRQSADTTDYNAPDQGTSTEVIS